VPISNNKIFREQGRSLALRPITYLKTVPGRIFKEDGVVIRGFVRRTFDIASTSARDNLRETIHLGNTGGPKSNATFVGDMTR
jgi:hypothetical protein